MKVPDFSLCWLWFRDETFSLHSIDIWLWLKEIVVHEAVLQFLKTSNHNELSIRKKTRKKTVWIIDQLVFWIRVSGDWLLCVSLCASFPMKKSSILEIRRGRPMVPVLLSKFVNILGSWSTFSWPRMSRWLSLLVTLRLRSSGKKSRLNSTFPS